MQKIQQYTTLQEQKVSDGFEEMFSGEVKVTLMFEDNSWRAMGGGLVRFKPFARTAWHSHPAGQTLIVLEGEIITQAEGEEARILTKGEIISCPPNLKHWHGSTEKGGVHIALTGVENKESVKWLEKVDNQECKSSNTFGTFLPFCISSKNRSKLFYASLIAF